MFLLSQFFFPFFCFSLLFCSVRALPPSTHSYSILFPHPPILPSLKTLSLSVLLTSCSHCVFLPYCPPPSTPVLLYLLNGFDQKDCYFLVFQSLLSLPSPAFVFSTHLKHTRLTPLFLSANHFLSFLCWSLVSPSFSGRSSWLWYILCLSPFPFIFLYPRLDFTSIEMGREGSSGSRRNQLQQYSFVTRYPQTISKRMVNWW